MTVVEREVVAPVVTERERRASILEAAALEIEVRGWNRGRACSVDGAVCLFGGLAFALGIALDRDGGLPERFFVPACSTWGPFPPLMTPIRWNDDHARDASDVTFLLRWRAAEIRDGL